MQIVETAASALVTGAITALVTVTAMRVELRWLRRDLDKLEKRVDQLDNDIRQFRPFLSQR